MTLELSVANAGEPIPTEMVQHLFQPFHRGQVRSNAQGLGLGLYIASEIAQAHGGRIDVMSNHSETRFIFRLPSRGPITQKTGDEMIDNVSAPLGVLPPSPVTLYTATARPELLILSYKFEPKPVLQRS